MTAKINKVNIVKMGGQTLIVPLLTCGLNKIWGTDEIAYTHNCLLCDVFNYTKDWNLHQLSECNEFMKEIKTTKLLLLKYLKVSIAT